MKKTLSFFNMIEVTLAIAVVGIGISGIMALFPVGVQATRDSIGDSYAPEVANMLLSYISSDGRKNTKWDDAQSSGSTGMIYALKTSKSEVASLADPTEEPLSTKIMYSSSSPGRFYVCMGSPATATKYSEVTIKDFNAEVRVWKAKINGMYLPGLAGSDSADLSYAYGSTIIIEVSWPLEKPYDTRTKRIFTMDLFNSNPT